MSNVLKRIKRCIIDGRVRFTFKAEVESLGDGLTRQEVLESILNADEIYKTIRSRSLHKGQQREYLYIIKSFSYELTLIYTKGKLQQEQGGEVFYILISAKLATEN